MVMSIQVTRMMRVMGVLVSATRDAKAFRLYHSFVNRVRSIDPHSSRRLIANYLVGAPFIPVNAFTLVMRIVRPIVKVVRSIDICRQSSQIRRSTQLNGHLRLTINVKVRSTIAVITVVEERGEVMSRVNSLSAVVILIPGGLKDPRTVSFDMLFVDHVRSDVDFEIKGSELTFVGVGDKTFPVGRVLKARGIRTVVIPRA